MTVPTKAKTWNLIAKSVYNSNVDTNNRMTLFEIKDALINGDGAWTVVSSSNKLVADNSDNWGDYTDLVWAVAGSAHSWIVLKQAGMGAPDNNLQMLIDCRWSSTTTENIEILISQKTGFVVGGSITNRPTATDEQSIVAGAWGVSNASYRRGINILKTSDGSCTRLVFTYSIGASQYIKVWFFDTPKNSVSWWANPYLAAVIEPTLALILDASNFKTRIDGQNVDLYLSGEHLSSALLTEHSLFQVPDYDGEWLIMPIGIVSDSATRRGRIGEVFDLFWIPINWPTPLYVAGGGDRGWVSIRDVLFGFTGEQLIWE